MLHGGQRAESIFVKRQLNPKGSGRGGMGFDFSKNTAGKNAVPKLGPVLAYQKSKETLRSYHTHPPLVKLFTKHACGVCGRWTYCRASRRAFFASRSGALYLP